MGAVRGLLVLHTGQCSTTDARAVNVFPAGLTSFILSFLASLPATLFANDSVPRDLYSVCTSIDPYPFIICCSCKREREIKRERERKKERERERERRCRQATLG